MCLPQPQRGPIRAECRHFRRHVLCNRYEMASTGAAPEERGDIGADGQQGFRTGTITAVGCRVCHERVKRCPQRTRVAVCAGGVSDEINQMQLQSRWVRE